MIDRLLRPPLSAVLLLGLAVSLVSGCGGPGAEGTPSPAPAPTPTGEPTATAESPRIVSIGASVTETLFALGLGHRVVAVDRTSIYPESVQALPRVGLPGQISVEGVAAARPTLILADGPGSGGAIDAADRALAQLEGLGLGVRRLGEAPLTVEAALARIEAIGEAVDASGPARALADRVRREVDAALAMVPGQGPRALFVYARGHRTLLVSGTETAAHALLELAGATNAVSAFSDFKPMSAETVIAAAPEVIVIPARGLASLGGPEGLFALPGLADTPAGRSRRVIAIDDLELLTFGPRLGLGLTKLVAALHGESRAE